MTKKNSLKGLLAAALLGASLYSSQAVAAQTHTVKAGDTLSQLAQTYKVSLEELARVNNLKDLNLIYVGQVLEISQAATDKVWAAAQPDQQVAVIETSESASANTGLSLADAQAKEIIAFKESSGSYTAQNGQYYGRYQLSLSYLNGDLSPENQERVADAYVTERYGSWSAALVFWQANGWY